MTKSLRLTAASGAEPEKAQGVAERFGWEAWGLLAASAAVGAALGHVVAHYGGGARARIAMVAGACLTALIVLVGPPDEGFGWSLVLGWTLLTLGAIDAVALRLPDIITAPLAVAGLLEAWSEHVSLWPRLAAVLIGWAALALLAWTYEAIRKRPGLGLGDAKLLGACGAWLGPGALPDVVLLACGFGFIWVMALAIRYGRGRANDPLPFGAPLALAAFLMWLRR